MSDYSILLGFQSQNDPEWNFTRGKPYIVTNPLGFGPRSDKPIECELCHHPFAVGEVARWQYVSRGAPNIFVCQDCDGPDVAERWAEIWRSVIGPALRRWGGD